MTLILLQVIIQSIASTLYWIGLYVGIRVLPGEKSRRLRWTVGSAAVAGGLARPARPRAGMQTAAQESAD